MSEINRKLASIRTISAIEPIEGADRIVLYKIDGWNVISQKDAFKVGDICVYFEIDSFLPVREAFEFLRKNCFKSTKNLGDGFRIKTMKMKGVVSQGLILPLSEVGLDGFNQEDDGFDLTDLLGVQKYEKPIPNHLQGKVRGNFPSFIPKTDQERIQNIRISDLENHISTQFEITTKMDGSSMTVYWKDGYFGVCSRNLDLKDETLDGGGENIFWKVAKELNLDKMELDGIAIQGELVGPGMNGNRARFERHHLFVFDIWDIFSQSYFSPKDRVSLCNRIGLEHAPILFTKLEFGSKITDKASHLKIAEGVKTKNEAGLELPGEGFVAKSDCGTFSWKAISNKYLLESEDE